MKSVRVYIISSNSATDLECLVNEWISENEHSAQVLNVQVISQSTDRLVATVVYHPVDSNPTTLLS